jgi:hypothetical protein
MLLGARLYDPTTAVSKSTAAVIAMTAIDTANLRLTFTVPSSGNVGVRLQGTIHGGSATPWFPQILLGVMSGSTVVGRLAPAGLPQGSLQAATTMVTVEATFTVPGQTPGASVSWDAAYGVETLATGSGLKYGGPNNTTANDAFGAFLFEVWDFA